MQWLLQALLLGCTFLLSVWVQLPGAALAGLGLVAAALLYRAACARGESFVLATVWIGSLAIWITVALSGIVWDYYYAGLAGLMSAAIWLGNRKASDVIWRARWKAVVMAWLLCGAFMWLGDGYLKNQKGEFYAGLFAFLTGLALCRWWFRWGAVGAQAINTLILLLVGLPLVDLALRPQSREAVRPETCRSYYSYDAAKGDPEAFGRWAEYYDSEFKRLGLEVFMPAPHTILPFRLRSGSHGRLMSCPISINSLGFRGPEITAAKNGVYRIVALGESTTFGMTIQPSDKPWPEVLEQIIRQRLKTRRPVQVINAGVPAYAIGDSLFRLPRDILPLQPDLLICYHGANGFSLIDSSVMPPLGPAPPVYRERPIKLAGQAEHRWRMWFFQWKNRRSAIPTEPRAGGPMETRCAAAYRQLIECARTNGIRLALANFSMAVNEASDPKVVDFYMGGGTRAAFGFRHVNAVHSLIVSRLAAEHPEVCFVDTHPHLDGEHEKFIDLLHFTGEGDRQMAENMFAGIRRVLEQDLGPP